MSQTKKSGLVVLILALLLILVIVWMIYDQNEYFQIQNFQEEAQKEAPQEVQKELKPEEVVQEVIFPTEEEIITEADYIKVINEVCSGQEQANTMQAVLYTFLEIESTFSEKLDVKSKNIHIWGPWQVRLEYFDFFSTEENKLDRFKLEDNCLVTLLLTQHNFKIQGGNFEATIMMYFSGYKYLNTPYEKLPRLTKKYVDDFNKLYPVAKQKFGAELDIVLKPERQAVVAMATGGKK